MITPLRPIRKVLDEIWAEFHKARYEDDQEIIEHLAYLLLRKSALQSDSGTVQPINNELLIAPPSTRYRMDEEAVQRLLASAETFYANKGGLAAFFDQAVLFYSTKWRQKHAYPVPRHIVDFMLVLLQIAPTHLFADFSCGHGGFLVHRYQLSRTHTGWIVGVEPSPDLARLAHANALLHGMKSNDINLISGNPFVASALFSPESILVKDDKFDRIAMAPPFDGVAEKELVEQLFPKISDRSNRLLFTRLALQLLKSEGQAALLVAEGLLSNAGASRQLRQELLEEHVVKAVITLQPGIFQPYVATAMHILHFQKGPATHPNQSSTWFIRIARDGYPLDGSRDLLDDVQGGLPSDLPLARAAILPSSRSFSNLFPGQPLLYKELAASVKGVVFLVLPAGKLISLRLFQRTIDRPTGPQTQSTLVAQVEYLDQLACLVMPFTNGEINVASNRHYASIDDWLQEIYPSTPRASWPVGRFLFSQGTAGQQLAITEDGRLLGFTKAREEIMSTGTEEGGEASFLLSVDYYWQQHAVPVEEPVSIARMLRQFQENQQRIDEHIESLRGQSIVAYLLDRPVPPRILTKGQAALAAGLGGEQQLIWESIRQLVMLLNETETTARYFTANALPGYKDEPLKVRDTLQVLDRLGLIVQVAQAGSSHYYRLATERDLPEGEEM